MTEQEKRQLKDKKYNDKRAETSKCLRVEIDKETAKKFEIKLIKKGYTKTTFFRKSINDFINE